MTLLRSLPEADISYTAGDRPREKEEFITQDLTIDIHSKRPQFSILVPDPKPTLHLRILESGSNP